MSQRELKDLQKIPGKRRRAIVGGMLGWGVPVFILTTVTRWHSTYGWHLPPNRDVYRALIDLPIWLVAGCLFGMFMWKLGNASFDSEN